jgi:ribose transport system ATP-binding protein
MTPQHAECGEFSARPAPSAGPQAARPRLAVAGLSKTFGLARVLDQVSLSIMPGEIHALVGHNGSGKSTLVKVLAGFHAPDPGCSVTLDGVPLHLPARAADLTTGGITFVHQDLGLVDSLSVSENCRIGSFTARRWSARATSRRGRCGCSSARPRARTPPRHAAPTW